MNGEHATKMMINKTCLTGLIAILFLLLAAGISFSKDANGDDKVKIGVLAKRGAEQCLQKWTPTAEYLSARIPDKTFVIIPLGYEQIYSSVERGEVDFILSNSSFYVELEHRYGANRIATLKNLILAKVKHTPDELAKKVAIALLEMPPDSHAAIAAKCAGWTIPMNYQSVHECLKYLKVGPYKDLGKITLTDIVKNYWYWFLSAAIIFVIMTGFIIEILNLNRRMSASSIRLAEEVSIRERAEKNLVKAKKAAESATEAKSAFLANISHEIRTPMNGVIAATDLALGEDLSPRVKRYLEIIQSSAYSLLELINDILDFSKVEAGRLELESRPFMLDAALDKVMDMFIKKSSEKNIELLVDMDLEMPRAFTGDSLRLQQIIKNLIDNAIKFTKKGGNILVGVRALEKTSHQATLAFFVKDTGVGIAPEYLSQLFKPFSQADVSFTRKYAGTGLGLSICKKLVEMMDGRIWVESELGKGSTFHFTATFKRRAKERKPRLIPPPDIQDLKVLVVDDCPDSRTIMQKILESFGFRPESVSSGKEGLSILKNNLTGKEPFELVIIDWRMPKMDGIEASRIIRDDLKLTIPIILMTAFGREAEKLEAQKAGINMFLTKPIFQSTLFNAIINIFGKESKEARPGKEITTKASISRKRLKGVRVQQLADALELADPEEINIHFKAVKEHLDFSTFQKLENQINNYDYDRALKTLKGIMEEIEGLGN